MENAKQGHAFQKSDWTPYATGMRFSFGITEREREALLEQLKNRVEAYFEHGTDALWETVQSTCADSKEWLNIEGFMIAREAAMIQFAYAYGKAVGTDTGMALLSDPLHRLEPQR